MTPPEPLSFAQLDAILHRFGLPGAAKVSQLGGGANQNYLVHTHAGRTHAGRTHAGRAYVVKRLVLQSPARLANDVAIAAQLRTAGLAAPIYLADRAGHILYDVAGVRAVVSAQLPGAHPDPLDDQACFALGVAAARFHRAVHTLPLPHVGWLNPLLAQAALAVPGLAPHQQAAQALIAATLPLFAASRFDGGLPRTVIHGDLHENNVLVAAPGDLAVTALLDFEEAEENLRVVDLARTLLSVCRSDDGTRLVAAKVAAVLAGYATQLALEVREAAVIPQALHYVIGVEVLWLDAHGFADEAVEHLQRVGPMV